jgi:hypothetical protein
MTFFCKDRADFNTPNHKGLNHILLGLTSYKLFSQLAMDSGSEDKDFTLYDVSNTVDKDQWHYITFSIELDDEYKSTYVEFFLDTTS